VIEDGGHVLAGAHTSGVMVLPEDLQQITVTGFVWIIFHLHSLGVVTQTPIRRTLLRASRETYAGAKYPGGAAELCLREPKSGHSKRGFLSFHLVACYETLSCVNNLLQCTHC